MRLIQINSVVNTTSTGHIVESIGNFANNKGVENFAIYGRKAFKSDLNLLRVGNIYSLFYHVLMTRFFDKHGFSSTRTTKQIVKKIETINPDIIHLHNLHGYYIDIKVLFKFLSRFNKPVVWTLHDCWAFTGHCTHYTIANCKRWRTECKKCPMKSYYPKSIFFDRSQSNYWAKLNLFNSLSNLTLVPVSKWLENEVKDSFLRNNSIHTIQNGIDLNTFYPRNLNNVRNKYHLNGKFMILGVANTWGLSKGLSDFIKISNYIDEDCIIILIGLRKKQAKNLPKNIIAVQRTENRAALGEFYSEADVYINTSIQESFGLTTVEAMACGTPSIVYKSTGTSEPIDNETGIVVEKGNIRGVLEAIKSIRAKPHNYYMTSCRRKAEAIYDKEHQIARYFKLYKNLLNK